MCEASSEKGSLYNELSLMLPPQACLIPVPHALKTALLKKICDDVA
jgi:hypothetical protein